MTGDGRARYGNWEWKTLSDDAPGDLRHHPIADGSRTAGLELGASRTTCPICGGWQKWEYGVIAHRMGKHIIFHAKFPHSIRNEQTGNIITSLLVDGKAQA